MEENKNTTAITLASPGSVLTFGILSLALCETVVLGLIFGFIAKSKAKAYIQAGGEIPGQVKAGRGLAIAGIICSFVMIVFWILYFVLIAGLMGSAVYYGNMMG